MEEHESQKIYSTEDLDPELNTALERFQSVAINFKPEDIVEALTKAARQVSEGEKPDIAPDRDPRSKYALAVNSRSLVEHGKKLRYVDFTNEVEERIQSDAKFKEHLKAMNRSGPDVLEAEREKLIFRRYAVAFGKTAVDKSSVWGAKPSQQHQTGRSA